MPFDINQTYSLLQALEQTFPQQTLFRDTFFPNMTAVITETVLMDYKKGNRQLAPFIAKGGTGVNVKRTGFVTKSYEPPMIMPQRPTTRDDLKNRGFGENVFSTQTPEQRAQELRANDMADLQDMITRRIEWMCAQLMLTGQFQAAGYVDDGKAQVVDTITYPDWTQKLTLTGTDTWLASDGKTPQGDPYSVLEEMSQTIARNSGRLPDVAICSYKTKNAFINNPKILEVLKIPLANNLSLMGIAPRITAPGVVRIGIIESLNLELYAYDGIYQDDSGATQQYLPDGYVIMGVSGRGSQLFGAVTQLESDNEWRTYQGKFVPKVWGEVGKDAQMIRVASKCVPKPEFIDDWYTTKVF